MTIRRFLQLDVFADRPGAGNPLAVVLDSEGMSDADMQAFAGWTNLSETIFLLPARDASASYRVRIFTPRAELPFAGHPSVGAAWAALDAGLAQAAGGDLVQECAAGLLPVQIDLQDGQRTVRVRTPPARLCPVETPTPLLERALRGTAQTSLPASLWNNGPLWWLVELEDEQSVRALEPDLGAIAALPDAHNGAGGNLAVFARTGRADDQLVVRAFTPTHGVPEDPVTGSANACIATMLHHVGQMPGNSDRYIASQGRELGRDGKVEIQIDSHGHVWIGGQVQAVIRGSVDW